MIRTQIQLTEDQFTQLKLIAGRVNQSMAALIRMAIGRFMKTEPMQSDEDVRKRALAAIGKFRSNVSNLSTHHDKYLSQIYSK
jgi:predicted transcriptional regulator